MTDEEFKSIALLAFDAAESPTYDDFMRKVHRWYSRSFSTPLIEVEGMADEYLLKHYFEDQYCALADRTDEEADKAWEETKGRLLAPFSKGAESEEDDFWEKALEEEFERDNPHLAKESKDSNKIEEKSALKEDEDGWVSLPNLKHEDVNIVGDDEIPED